jgi:outer membrane protein TolC
MEAWSGFLPARMGYRKPHGLLARGASYLSQALRNSFVIFFAGLLVAISLTGNSVASAQVPLNLEETIAQALKNNPEILAFKKKYEAANARIWQAASLNDPMLEFEHDRITADRELSGKPMNTYAVSQDIPFPTKLYLRAKIASRLAKIAYENYKAKEREVVAEVKRSYSETFIIYRLIEVTQENKQILEQLFKSVTARYAAGQISQADVLKAQVEIAKLDNELITLEQRRLTTQARLNVLLNKDPKEEIGMPAPEGAVKFTRTLDDFYRLAKNSNPELKAYGYAIERGRAAYQLSLNEFLPDFQVKYKQMIKKGEAEGGMWAGMVGVSIPLWFFQKQAFGVKEMKSDLQMLEAEYKMKENMVLFDIRDAYARLEANKKLVALYETAFIPQAEATIKAALKGYESGKSDFLNLLDSIRMLIDFKLERYRSILELRLALADIERAVGADVEFK